VRILALMTDAFGGYGGIAQYNRDFVAALAAAPGVEAVDVLPRIAPDTVGALPDRVTQHPARRNKLIYSLAALAAANANRPDVVLNGHLYHGPLARIIARRTGARMISQLHGTEVSQKLHNRHVAPLAHSDIVLTVSRDTLGLLRDQVLSEPDNGMVLANTVQPEFTPGDRQAARARFGLGNQSVLLSVGRLDQRERYKGHNRIIELLPALRASGRDVIYLIAGMGDDQPRLEALAARHNVSPWVRFLGKVPYKHLPDLYRAADLFVLPSTGEGFGIVFLEAMACGTPALGLAVGGAPDALGDGELGYCVTAENLPAALAKALDDPRPDPHNLHDAVQARFGQTAFRSRVASIIGSLN
jgi:phosphatidylinositol alpha-1,6-mannosyltransferase